jgi:EAL domain-containing protein (putative c-di-GMP-specific phosphodiesterase class I)/CheY-like chemotaxis protein
MQGDLSKLSVLIVEDSRYVSAMLRRYLGQLGVTGTLTAEDGADGLAEIDAGAVDVVICDLNMPGMDGIEFLRHLAARPQAPAVILISGEAESILNTAVRLGRAHGLWVIGAMTKPFRLAPFRALLQQLGGDRGGPHGLSFEPLTPEEIRAGLRGDAVELVFQPKVSAGNGMLNGVETFLRWRAVDGGLKGPGAVIPIAEASGLINEVTEQVFRKAMVQCAAWRAAGYDFTIAVNVSMYDLDRYDFPEFIVGTAASHGVDPASIILEVTESQIMSNVVKPLEVLSRLRLKGVGLSIDDYGTGASSMQQLKRVPFTELKIDREFVTGACEDGAARAMLTSSIGLGKDLGLRVVAEGVETEAEWRLVTRRGVDLVQGYYVARPMSAAQFDAWSDDWASSTRH